MASERPADFDALMQEFNDIYHGGDGQRLHGAVDGRYTNMSESDRTELMALATVLRKRLAGQEEAEALAWMEIGAEERPSDV